MKAIILTPTFFPQLTGNAVTAGRIAQEMTESGIECRVIDLSIVGEMGRHISGNASLLAEKTGFLFRNREELYKQILRILRNKKEASEAGRRAKRFIAARFRHDREQVDYLRLYRETANQRFSRSSRSINHPISHSGATSIGPGSG